MSEPTKKTNHTLTPWQIQPNPNQKMGVSIISRDPASNAQDVAQYLLRADAEFIIKAVNEREALLAENESLKRQLVSDCADLKIERDQLLGAAIQGLAALGSADINGYQNSLCKEKALKMLKEAIAASEKRP